MTAKESVEGGGAAEGRRTRGRSVEVDEVALPLTPPPVAQCTSNKLSAAVIALRPRRRGVSLFRVSATVVPSPRYDDGDKQGWLARERGGLRVASEDERLHQGGICRGASL